MSVKSKTRKRLIVLLAAVLGMGAAAGGLWIYHLHRVNRYYAQERALGLQAAKAGDAAETVRHLMRSLARNPNDLEALDAYATQRIRLESADRSHVWDVIGRLRRMVDLEPGNVETRHRLMRIYARYGFTTESLDAANAILAIAPSDIEAVRAKTAALLRLRRFKEASQAAERWCQLAPQDPEPVLQLLELMAQDGRPSTEILARARQVDPQHPDSPMAELALGAAYWATGDMASAKKRFGQAAGQKMPSAAFAVALANLLNGIGLSDDSLKLLQRVAQETGDADVRLEFVRRLWEANRPNDVLAATQDAATLGTEAIAFRALSLAQLGKPEEARQTAALLQKGDAAADAWSLIVQQQLDPRSVTPRQILDACRRVAPREASGGYLRYYAGVAFVRLEERDLAAKAFEDVHTLNPTWAMPVLLLSDIRLSRGQIQEALDLAQEASRRAPTNRTIAIHRARVLSAYLEAGHTERADELLNLLAAIRKDLPSEENTMAIQVATLSRLGRRDEAIAALKPALAAKPPPSEAILLRLAGVCRSGNLGLADQCLELSEQTYGLTANLAYTRAFNLFSEGKTADGLATLQAAREKSGKAGELEWELAWARYLEITRDPRAKAEWMRLAEKRPEDRTVQQLVLNMPSVHGDRDFISRTIDRLHKITGEEDLTWKLARARWMMEGAKTDEDLAQASVLLKDVVRVAPHLVEPHLLLAQDYEKLGNRSLAIDQLEAATAADPDNTGVSIYLSSLLLQRGDSEKARQALDRVTSAKAVPLVQRRQAAELLAQQGDAEKAIALLEQDGATRPSTNPSDALLLAKLYGQRNQLDKAEQLVAPLLQQKPDEGTIQFAAELYAQMGRAADAEKALAQLDSVPLKPGIKELIRADFATRHSTPEQAIALFKAAIAADQGSSTAWRALAAFYAYLGRDKEMLDTADAGLKANPADPLLKQIAVDRELLVAGAADPETRALTVNYFSDVRADSPALSVMRIVQGARASQEAPEQTLAKLRKVADDAPQFLPAQLILIQRCLLLHRNEEAAQLATRAVRAFPSSPDPARLAGQALAAQLRWSEALDMARTWRERSMGNPLAADLVISQTLVQLQMPAQAAEQLAPYLSAARLAPDQEANSIVLQQYARSLILAGQADKAAELLWPLAQQQGNWRIIWSQMTLACDPATAASWLERVSPLIPPEASAERSAVGMAWHNLGLRGGNAGYVKAANAIFAELAARPDVSAAILVDSGMAAEAEADSARAEQAYRRALSLDPTNLVAQNNLAMLLMRRGGNLSEAIKLAQEAVRQHPRMATLYDTLAQIQARAGKADDAIASLKQAMDLEPNEPAWRVHLARVLFDAGKRKEADRVVIELAAMPPGGPRLSEAARQQLETLRAEMANQGQPAPPQPATVPAS